MKLTIVNNTSGPLPIASANEGGWAEAIEPGQTYMLDRPESTVAIIGAKPDFMDDFTGAIETFLKFLAGLITRWKDHNKAAAQPDPPTVSVTLTNSGENSIRTLLGNNTAEYQLQAGETYEASAPGYVELRELGGYTPPHGSGSPN